MVNMRAINLVLKRLMDIFGSLIGIVILLPVLIIVALAIKIDSKSPVFFKQERLGKNGKVFKILKFRTMIVNAENIGDGLKVKSSNDLRITKIGKFLRKTSLDELPQLFNVFIGNMSLVGPRPPVPYHPYKITDYSNMAKKRFDFKPGITGLTQITVRNSVSWDERIKVDIKYVNSFTVFLDIKILLMTFIKIFSKNDIYIGKNN